MNSRYESLVLDAIPAACKRAVDGGCGNGGLTRDLRARGIPSVLGIDSDGPCIQRCKDHPEAGDICYLVGDLLTSELEQTSLAQAGLAQASFDLVSAVASLHHMDVRSGLIRLRSLVAPGGVLVVIGLAKPDLPKDIPIEVAAQIVSGIRRRLVSGVRRRPSTADSVPKPPIVWPPPERYATMRRLAREVLPGVRWRRHLLWRYSLVWRNAED
jgi:2-polyprenyl-3-methyl-5-hydroxy-6-metoxy-1,4-benzoquinol methylase